MSLQAGAREILDTARISKVWKVAAYPTPGENRPPNLISEFSYSDEPDNGETPGRELQKALRTNFPHKVYFNYFYNWVRDKHKDLVDVQEIQSQRGNSLHVEPSESQVFSNFEGFEVDGSSSSEPSLWLLAAVAMSLSTHISPESATFAMVAEAFDREGERASITIDYYYSNGPRTSRLKADLGYWRYFAQTRGLHLSLSNDRFATDSLSTAERDELYNLVVWLIGIPQIDSWSQTNTVVKINSKVGEVIVQSLVTMRLQISWDSEHNLVSCSKRTSNDIISERIFSEIRPAADASS